MPPAPYRMYELMDPVRATSAYWVIYEASTDKYLICQAAFDGYMRSAGSVEAVGTSEAFVMLHSPATGTTSSMKLKVVSEGKYWEHVAGGAGAEYSSLSDMEKAQRKL